MIQNKIYFCGSSGQAESPNESKHHLNLSYSALSIGTMFSLFFTDARLWVHQMTIDDIDDNNFYIQF
jgi:hypothetical protein